jgi:predicted porin
MNLKTTAIAAAVAGSLVAPMAAQADVYASARLGIVNSDVDGGAANMAVQGLGSRFGAKSETDLGNGMTGFGKYEWSVGVDGKNIDGVGSNGANIGLRHGIVGLKGDFGKVTLGRTYHTFYSHAVGPNDNPWWGSGYAMISYTGRTGNAISYAGSGGAVGFGVTVYMNADAEEDATDGIELGATIGLGDMSLGLGLQSIESRDNDVIGATLTGIAIGDGSIGFGMQVNDDDSSFLVDAGFGPAYVHFETITLDAADATQTSLTLGYTKGLGPKTTSWFEFQTKGNDDVGSDFTTIRAMLKYDIL